MQDKIGSILIKLGWIFIVLGTIVGVISFINVDRETYQIAKESYEELWDNEFAEAAYNTAKQIYIAELDYALMIIFGGIISGFVFIGFGTVIELLRKKYDQDEFVISLLREIRDKENK